MQPVSDLSAASFARCGGGMGHRFDVRSAVDTARQACEQSERLVAGLRRQMRRVVDDMDELSRQIAQAHRAMVESRRRYFEQLDISIEPAVVPGRSWTPIESFPGGGGHFEVVVQWDGFRENPLADGVHVRVITVSGNSLSGGALVSMGRFGRVLPLMLSGLPDAAECDIEWVEAGAVITHYRAVSAVLDEQKDGVADGGT